MVPIQVTIFFTPFYEKKKSWKQLSVTERLNNDTRNPWLLCYKGLTLLSAMVVASMAARRVVHKRQRLKNTFFFCLFFSLSSMPQEFFLSSGFMVYEWNRYISIWLLFISLAYIFKKTIKAHFSKLKKKKIRNLLFCITLPQYLYNAARIEKSAESRKFSSIWRLDGNIHEEKEAVQLQFVALLSLNLYLSFIGMPCVFI